MPNHCRNEVLICGLSEGAARSLAELLEGEESLFDFNKLLPEPPELLKETEDPAEKARRARKYGHVRWYEWRLANWGVKWNSYECDRDDADLRTGRLLYIFTTPWAPPEGICRKLLEYLDDAVPDASVEWLYDEPLVGLRGNLEKELA